MSAQTADGRPCLAGPALRRWGLQAAKFVVLGLACAFFYTWAAARFYRSDTAAGFGYGLVHGAAMPMALPALVAGQDPPIYAARNTGRSYKLGYIIGINLCGLCVFGVAFWRPPPAQKSQPQ